MKTSICMIINFVQYNFIFLYELFYRYCTWFLRSQESYFYRYFENNTNDTNTKVHRFTEQSFNEVFFFFFYRFYYLEYLDGEV